MVLFFHRIRIQRVKIHLNSRVSAAGQCTFLWAYVMNTINSKYVNSVSIVVTLTYFFKLIILANVVKEHINIP